MAAGNLEILTLTEQGTGYEYAMYPVTEVDERQEKPAFSVSPPGLSARQNILLGLQGQQATIDLQFAIWDDGVDRANSTYSSSVITVAEQINYLRDEIHQPTFTANWTLDHTTGGQFDSKVYDSDNVYVESMQLPTISEGNPLWKPATITLRRGSSA